MPQDKAQSGTPQTPDPSQYSKLALNVKAAQNTPTPPVQKLMNVGKRIVTNPAWLPHNGKTYCNFGVWTAVTVLKGYEGFTDAKGNPILADDMIRVMSRDLRHWKPATAQDAWDNALFGGLSIACYSAAPDGHVAVVAPTQRVWSDKFSGYQPPVYNVGKTMNLQAPYSMGEGFAFIYKPNHYIYVG